MRAEDLKDFENAFMVTRLNAGAVIRDMNVPKVLIAVTPNPNKSLRFVHKFDGIADQVLKHLHQTSFICSNGWKRAFDTNVNMIQGRRFEKDTITYDALEAMRAIGIVA